MSFAALIDHQAAKDVHYIYISLSAVFLLFRPPMHPGESKVVVRTPVHGLLEAEVRASKSCDHTMFSHNPVPECSRVTQYARRTGRS